jgi:hypothetical protein
MFNMGVILFALIAVNLMSSGVKMEGFEEGAGDVKAECQKKVKKFADFDKDVKKLNDDGKLYKGNNVDYSQLSKHGDAKTLGGACNGYIAANYKATAKAPVKAAPKKK